MCKSVPQIEAARTRTSTSVGPIVGTPTDSSCAPRCGRILRRAFIVEDDIRMFGAQTASRQTADVNTRPYRPKVQPNSRVAFVLFDLPSSWRDLYSALRRVAAKLAGKLRMPLQGLSGLSNGRLFQPRYRQAC